jgi:CelD/BcsL family acetyltransferase involved in cellulose biosynthesis
VTDCEPIASLEAVREEWSELAGRSENVFATWEWADTWWRHFGADGELALLRCSRGGETFAVIPLYAERQGPFRLLRFIGRGAGDALGPICDPGDAGAAAEALLKGLRAGVAGRWDALLAERVPAGAFGTELGGRVLQVEASPVLDIAGRDWGGYLAGSSRNLREKLGRNTRRLERDHELAYRLCEDPDRIEERMDTLQRLHGLQWSEGSSFGHRSLARFHREFASIAMRQGWLRLWMMELDGEPVAAWYGFRLGATEAYYQSGRDPRWDRFSVGFLMLMRTLRGAFDDGLERYAFLRGDESYKNRFATSDGRLETRALGNGPHADAAIGVGAIALRLPWLRRRIVAATR